MAVKTEGQTADAVVTPTIVVNPGAEGAGEPTERVDESIDLSTGSGDVSTGSTDDGGGADDKQPPPPGLP